MNKNIITSAIQQRRLIGFTYDHRPRIVEPFLLGRTTAGNDALRAWQVRGDSKSKKRPPWRLFLLKDMSFVQVLNETFDGIRPDYNPNDSDMEYVYIHI